MNTFSIRAFVRAAALVALCAISFAQSDVVGWGFFRFDSSWSQGPFARVKAGWDHSMAIRSDGSAVAWGINWSERCTVPALPPGLSYVDIDSGEDFVTGLRSDGTVVAWGANYVGQCNVPALPPGLTYVEIAAGWISTLARRSDGSVVAWGGNWWGECNVPPLPAGLSYVEVAIGYDHSLARRSDGSVVAWGSNNFGQCDVPALPPGLTYTQISGRGINETPYDFYASHCVALRSDGSVIAWGNNDFGQCSIPVLPPGLIFEEVHAGAFHNVARLSDGSIIGWGRNDRGQCNVPAAPAGTQYVECSAGLDHNLALLDNGEFVSWGSNCSFQGKLPNAPNGLAFVEVSSGGHVLTLLSDGSAIAFGSNNVGQCNVPAPPPGLVYTDVAVGGYDVKTNPAYWSGTSVLLRSDGSVAVFGDNSAGQCNVPAPPPGLAYVEVAAGFRHVLARLSDGSIVAWGENGLGQCNVPALPPGLSYTEVAASVRNSAARRSDGSVVVWGDNSAGQCNVPVLPPGVAYVEVDSGYQCSMARRSDGSVIAWGDNSLGQCNVPALPPGVTYVEISAAVFYSGPPWDDIRSNTLARRSDGVVVAWGDNINGQCNIPAPGPGRSYQRISASGNFTVALLGSGASCLPPSNYCVSAMNSRGGYAAISSQGSTSIGANDFVLTVSGCPPHKPGLFFYGSFQTQIPFGEGYLCVTGNQHRLQPGVWTSNNGDGIYFVDFTNPQSAASLIQPGMALNFQFWHRDPQTVGHGFNLSDALHAEFCP